MTKISKLLLVLAAAGAASAQESITIKINSGANCTTHVGGSAFAAQAWSFGATQPTPNPGIGAAAAKSVISNVNVTKQMDECSTALFGMVAAGTYVASVTLTQTDPSGRTLLTALLEGVIVAGYEVAGTATSPTPAESVSFAFTKITITYSGGNGNTVFKWDIAAQRAG
jgi:type VI protein secretion system component Hcp